MTPGDNLLLDALDVIAPQLVQYMRYTGSTTTGAGREVPQFAATVPVPVGSLQAVDKARYQLLGLDLQKNYVMWFVPANVVGTQRNSQGDRISYGGKLYQLESTVTWFAQDGWMKATCVEIANA